MPRQSKGEEKRVSEYSFRLLLDVAHDLGDDDLHALYEATQSDATFGSDDHGWSAEFDREAPDYASAVLKAIAQLENASVGVHVRKLVSDDESLVSAAEIGRRAGLSRQAVNDVGLVGIRGKALHLDRMLAQGPEHAYGLPDLASVTVAAST